MMTTLSNMLHASFYFEIVIWSLDIYERITGLTLFGFTDRNGSKNHRASWMKVDDTNTRFYDSVYPNFSLFSSRNFEVMSRYTTYI
jgi:hypothetical protein